MDIERGSFVWNAKKEQVNLDKHGIDFTTAQKAFTDENRKIYVDAAHSQKELRYFCLGSVDNNILTVRFAYQGGAIRIIGAGYWRKGKKYYEE